jgi:hypothetical protein
MIKETYSSDIVELARYSYDKKSMISLSLNKINKTKIIEVTSFMDSFYPIIPLKIRCLAILNNYNEYSFPKCENCGSPTGFDKEYQNSFNRFCSDKCSKEFGRLPIETKKKLSDYVWLYEKRITEHLTYDAIGNLFGISHVPVVAACKKLDSNFKEVMKVRKGKTNHKLATEKRK